MNAHDALFEYSFQGHLKEEPPGSKNATERHSRDLSVSWSIECPMIHAPAKGRMY